eukprot:TRINITY_DN7517_c0_g1_i2.p2 TRINITY_DN7517_c0_g1~~TRINITY_DN7517_c0_g1_i2.p2  ORF type:complete len:284 (+),score=54.50 TRINITY_DN7517_c0_g1_i2:59-910(+)
MAVAFGRRRAVGATSRPAVAAAASDGGARRSEAFRALLAEDRERERQEYGVGAGTGAGVSAEIPVQQLADGNVRIFLEVAVFRGAFFGVDYQDVLEFEMYPDAAPAAVRRLLEDCAGGRLRELLLGRITDETALLPAPGGAAAASAADGERGAGPGRSCLRHDAAGVLSASRNTPELDILLTLRAAPQLDRSRVAFGKLLRGEALLPRIAACRPVDGVAIKEARIVGCGEVLRGGDRDRGASADRGPKRSRSRSRSRARSHERSRERIRGRSTERRQREQRRR